MQPSDCVVYRFNEMEIDMKNVQVYIWRTLMFFMITSYAFTQNHPIFSVVYILFLVYMFLPRLFYLFICSSPLVICTGYFLYSKLHYSVRGDGKRENEKPESVKQRNTSESVRRNVNEKCNRGWDRQKCNKAVEWTKDDEKNVMDVGDSENERNKRLETLIAKQRAKRLYKMNAQKNLIDMDTVLITPIHNLRDNSFDGLGDAKDILTMDMPGSAPSVLLKTSSPFHPPDEMKLDATADGFGYPDFASANQKEMLLSRHESFCWGPVSPLEFNQRGHEPALNRFFATARKGAEVQGLSRFKILHGKGNGDQLVEQFPSQNIDSMFRTVSATDLVVHEPQPSTSKLQMDKETDDHHGAEAVDQMQTYKDEELSIDGNLIHMKEALIDNGRSSPSSSFKASQHICHENRPVVSEVVRPTVDKMPEDAVKAEGSMTSFSHKAIPEKLEEVFSSPVKSTVEIKEDYDAEDLIIHENGNMEDLYSTNNHGDGTDISMVERDSTPNEDDSNSGKHAVHKKLKDLSKMQDQPESTEYVSRCKNPSNGVVHQIH